MVKVPHVTKVGPIAKGPIQFLRYLNKDKLSAELVDLTKVERKKMEGKTYVSAKTFRENTANLALVKVSCD